MIKNIFNFITLFILSIYTALTISCFTYGSPDSFIVNFVGRDLDNFIEYNKIDSISITERDLTIIYRKDILVKMGPPEKPAKGEYQVSYLVLKMLGNSEEIIIHENIVVKKVIVDKKNNQLFYTFVKRENKSDKNYLIIYDLKNIRIINEIMVMDDIKYRNEDIWLSSGYISNMFFDDINNQILFEINYKTTDTSYNGYDYLSLDINTGEIKEISENTYKEILNYLNIPNSSFVYIFDNRKKELFTIFPYSDYLPANFKHKYNGIYINDGLNNIRISKTTKTYFGNPPLWIDDGQYVIYGSYIFDTSGKKKEVKIADGNIYGVY